VTNFSAVAALVDTTIKWGTGVGKTSEVLFGRRWPFVKQSGTLRFVREKVANSILLAGFTLKVDVGPGVTMVLLLWHRLARNVNETSRRWTNHCNEIDAVTTLAELLFETRIGVVRSSFGQNQDSPLEVGDIPLITRGLEQVPSLVLRLLSNAGVVDQLGILAFHGSVACSCQHTFTSFKSAAPTLLLAILALVNASWAVGSPMTWFAVSDCRFQALSLYVPPS
jgi:hypothetical protein